MPHLALSLHQYHERMPFVYVCILCDEVYHDTEFLLPGNPPVCHECRSREEDTARACWTCGSSVWFDSPICATCESRIVCDSEMPTIKKEPVQ